MKWILFGDPKNMGWSVVELCVQRTRQTVFFSPCRDEKRSASTSTKERPVRKANSNFLVTYVAKIRLPYAQYFMRASWDADNLGLKQEVDVKRRILYPRHFEKAIENAFPRPVCRHETPRHPRLNYLFHITESFLTLTTWRIPQRMLQYYGLYWI